MIGGVRFSVPRFATKFRTVFKGNKRKIELELNRRIK
jgi:hypothetical protein